MSQTIMARAVRRRLARRLADHMSRPDRQPLVALLAALAALLAPVGATAAGSVAAAVRHATAGAAAGAGAGATQTTGQAPAGRLTTGRELRDTAVRRVQHGGTQVRGVVTAGAERAGQGGPGHVPAGALAAAVLLVAAAWWVRRSTADRAPAGRTTGIRSGRGPPALARA